MGWNSRRSPGETPQRRLRHQANSDLMFNQMGGYAQLNSRTPWQGGTETDPSRPYYVSNPQFSNRNSGYGVAFPGTPSHGMGGHMENEAIIEMIQTQPVGKLYETLGDEVMERIAFEIPQDNDYWKAVEANDDDMQDTLLHAFILENPGLVQQITQQVRALEE